MNIGNSTTYTKAPGETTEWDEILRSKGILPPLEDAAEVKRLKEQADAIEDAAAAVDPLASKKLHELDALEEDDEYADTRILDTYREKRIAQLKELQSRSKYGSVTPLSRQDFVAEVTVASAACPVILLLYKDAVPDSRILYGLLQRVAEKHRASKFMAIVSDSCIENYPDRNVPTVFVYRNGEVTANIVGLAEFGGQRATLECVEWALAQHEALTTELEEDPRKALRAQATTKTVYR